MNTAAWLVDVGYVVKASEGLFRLDYVRARRLVEERCGSTGAFLFNGYDVAYGIPAGLQAFYETMRQHGMEVRLQPMQSGAPGAIDPGTQANRQRRVDVDLGAHLVWQASLADVETLVVTTGDQVESGDLKRSGIAWFSAFYRIEKGGDRLMHTRQTGNRLSSWPRFGCPFRIASGAHT